VLITFDSLRADVVGGLGGEPRLTPNLDALLRGADWGGRAIAPSSLGAAAMASLFTGLRPWRCRACDSRFYAWAAPIGYIWYVHCGLCGNMDLQRISSEHGMGLFSWVYRLFRLPAYRCAPCRNRFFSFRIYRRIVPTQQTVEPRVESHPIPH
jgi:hypothetical protein